MPIVDLPDGNSVEFPEGTPIEAMEAALKSYSSQPKQLTGMGKAQVSIPGRIAQGMADPMIGTAQLAGKVFDEATRPLDYIGENVYGFSKDWNKPYPGAEPGKEISKFWSQYEKDYQSNRKAAGQEGWDAARFAGNVFSPMSVAMGAAFPAAAVGSGIGKMALKGAQIGALGGLTNFADEGDGSNFWAKKATQGLAPYLEGHSHPL